MKDLDTAAIILTAIGCLALGIAIGNVANDSSWKIDCGVAGVHVTDNKAYQCSERK